MDDNLKLLGKRLKSLRKHANLTRADIEELYQISVQSLMRWENGISEVGAIKLYNYLKIFNNHGISVSLDAILDNSSEVEIKKIERVTL